MTTARNYVINLCLSYVQQYFLWFRNAIFTCISLTDGFSFKTILSALYCVLYRPHIVINYCQDCSFIQKQDSLPTCHFDRNLQAQWSWSFILIESLYMHSTICWALDLMFYSFKKKLFGLKRIYPGLVCSQHTLHWLWPCERSISMITCVITKFSPYIYIQIIKSHSFPDAQKYKSGLILYYFIA